MRAHLLEELIDDVLIQQEIVQEQTKGGSSEWFQVAGIQEMQAAILGTPGEARYRDFLRDARLIDEEVATILSVFLRRRQFQHFLSSRPDREGWHHWIERRRGEAKIEYFSASRSAQKKH